MPGVVKIAFIILMIISIIYLFKCYSMKESEGFINKKITKYCSDPSKIYSCNSKVNPFYQDKCIYTFPDEHQWTVHNCDGIL